MKRIYVASSWRNPYQRDVVDVLRMKNHQVYDYRNPCAGNTGFSWSKCAATEPEKWDMTEFRMVLAHPAAVTGFALDFAHMNWADMGVLVLPSGNDAHMEAGFFVGAGKPLIIYSPEMLKPGLLYKTAHFIVQNFDQLNSVMESL